MREPKVEINMARKIAHYYSRRTGVNYDDMLGEALLEYARALEAKRDGTYDPEKSAFTTYAWMRMRSRLGKVVNHRRYRPIGAEEPSLGIPDEASAPPDRRASVASALSGLPDDAALAVRMVLESPAEYAGMNRYAAQLRVRRELRERGLNTTSIFASVRAALGRV